MDSRKFTIQAKEIDSHKTGKILYEGELTMPPSKDALKYSLEKVLDDFAWLNNSTDNTNNYFGVFLELSIECEDNLGHMVGDMLAWAGEIHFSLWDKYHDNIGFKKSIGQTYPVRNADKIPIYAMFNSSGYYGEVTREKPQPEKAMPFQSHCPLYNVQADVIIDDKTYPYNMNTDYGFDEFAEEIYESAQKHGETDFHLQLRCEPATNAENRSVFYMRDIKYTAGIADSKSELREYINDFEKDWFMVVRMGRFEHDEERYVSSMLTESVIQNIDGAIYAPDMGGFSTEFAEYL